MTLPDYAADAVLPCAMLLPLLPLPLPLRLPPLSLPRKVSPSAARAEQTRAERVAAGGE